MSALLPREEENFTRSALPRNRFARRSNPVSIFEQVKTETIRYHTLLQAALTYLKELASFDPDCCLVSCGAYTSAMSGRYIVIAAVSLFCACALLYVANYKLSAPPISQSTSLFLVR